MDPPDNDDYIYSLPRELFFSTTLVTLKLTCKRCRVTWSMGYSLPMLKSLYIDSDLVFGGEFEKFVTSFPVLEELRVSTMSWHDLNVTVSSPTLRRLSLRGSGTENTKRFSFDTPNLLFLDYSDLVAEDYPVVNMGKLLEARIIVSVNYEWTPNDVWFEANEVLRFSNVVKLMNGLQNVERLTLTLHTLEVLANCCDMMQVFNNLKFLSVMSGNGRGWQAVPAILRNCPRLETIIIEGLLHCVTDECGDACPCVSSKDKGRSLTSCPVNRLEVKRFRATIQEMDMIKHFLDYFPCLKRLDVFIDPVDFRHCEVSELTIEMFELYNKLSPSCNVKLFVGLEMECTRAHLKMKTQTKTFTCFDYFCFVLFLLFLWCYYLFACHLRNEFA